MKIEYSALYHELTAKQSELSRQLVKLDEERRALAMDGEPDFSSPADSTADRVAELLGKAPPKVEPTKRERLETMARESRALRAALDLLENQIRLERQRCEAQIRAGIAPEYTKRLKAIADALKVTHKARLDLSELTDELERAGVSIIAFAARPPGFLGEPSNANSAMASWFREMAAEGIIKHSEIPAELQPR